MSSGIILHQGTGITKDEWRLQRRSWGTWLVGLFLLAVVLSEHPIFWGQDYSVAIAAGIWADRTSLVGSLVATLTVPFALDRVRRQRVAPIEFSKPFEKIVYVIGKFLGAVWPLTVVTFVSMSIHIAATLLTAQDAPVFTTFGNYLNQMFIIAFPSLFFAASITYCLSIYIRRPIIIIPLYIFYLNLTALTQAAADAKFSWFSPLVRPEYFRGVIPVEWMPATLVHQILYLMLGVGALAMAAYGFQRTRFIGKESSIAWRKRFRLPRLSRLGVKVRMQWGGAHSSRITYGFFRDN